MQYSARLGVFALDTGSHRTVSYRAGERFAFASTFKSLACGVLLAQAPDLGKLIRYDESVLLPNSPITSATPPAPNPLSTRPPPATSATPPLSAPASPLAGRSATRPAPPATAPATT
ncbi:hypothetical protein [Kribbella sp. NPDC051620]|uniref:hypothetical protein n=1 Tax=Kribbella sp. NPDC051620 TaxID=3364120 RepID=UPI0037893092